MKPHLLKIALNPEHSFNVRYDIVPHFYDKWHYHHEVELVYIIKGTGLQFIGDEIYRWKPGDMLLIGSNLPHLWRSDEEFLLPDSLEKVEAIVVHFLPSCFGADFFSLPEHQEINRLLNQSKKAFRIQDACRDLVADKLFQLLKASKSKRTILLLDILSDLADSPLKKPVLDKESDFINQPSEMDRLNNIYQYILNNFTEEVSLDQAAQIAHLTPPAFCRYFKTRTRKTFSRFLLELRTAHAAKLLTESSKTVAEICYESGFNNFSNFNRHFKNIIGRTPLEHRKFFRVL
ncbi:AraC family transcriptional regulator [Pedobacter aquae]|uniref:AraC family transcriptional regulator n=1 Tax=Pedobacter aquae TaxID=2605747 RepID=A0A5C0VI05_9SPHI|nr:AraC family transcriptional regulator [Pedobacter aquae]QEK52305.1 AraC family transcriptional regulator [Pedobacter aquae]